MEEPDSGYTIDQHLAPPGAAAHELASAGHQRILIKLSLRETQQRQVEAPTECAKAERVLGWLAKRPPRR
jgi:hypothetical protein